MLKAFCLTAHLHAEADWLGAVDQVNHSLALWLLGNTVLPFYPFAGDIAFGGGPLPLRRHLLSSHLPPGQNLPGGARGPMGQPGFGGLSAHVMVDTPLLNGFLLVPSDAAFAEFQAKYQVPLELLEGNPLLFEQVGHHQAVEVNKLREFDVYLLPHLPLTRPVLTVL